MIRRDFIKKINCKPFISLLAILILWELSVRVFKFPTYILPSPISVFIAIFKYYDVILSAMLVTIYEAMVGYGLSILIGLPIVINTAVGLYRIDENKVNLVKALKGTQYQIFVKVRLPNALPSIFAGMKLAITLALIGAVVGEFVGGSHGIGVLILSASTEIQTAVVFACIIVLSIIGIVLFYSVELAQKLSIPWYKEKEKM